MPVDPRALLRHQAARGYDMHGQALQVVGTATLARCLQHETDHLDGVLFIDRLDAESRKAAMKAIREAEWAGGTLPVVKVSPHAQGHAGPNHEAHSAQP
jgi:peptide deformylase